MTSVPELLPQTSESFAPDLTRTLQTKLSNPASSPDFDLHGAVNQVLADAGMSVADTGGKLTFYGNDPIVPSRIRFGAMAAIGLAAKSVAVAALWRSRTGEGQDISVDVRKALRRFCCFFEGKWETMNGRPPAMGADKDNPFLKLPLFRETRDGRHVVPLDFYPKLRGKHLAFSGAVRPRNRFKTPFCSGARRSWKPPRRRLALLWPWCAPTRNFSGSYSTRKSSPQCL